MITSHPSDEALAEMASGRLAAGPRIVLATHLAGCPQCRHTLRAFETLGGGLLHDIDPVVLASDAFARTLARIDAPGPAETPLAPSRPDLPGPLGRCPVGPWRYVHPSVRWRRVGVPDDPAANVIMLKVAAGCAVPSHTHTGREFTQVLSGGFSDSVGTYLAGDCVEADQTLRHQPMVDDDGECVVLASVEGRLKLSSWIGRLFQPLVGL